MFLVSHNKIHYSEDSNWGEIIGYQLKETAALDWAQNQPGKDKFRPAKRLCHKKNEWDRFGNLHND